MLIKLSNWSCLEITTQDEITMYRLIILPLKRWKISHIGNKYTMKKHTEALVVAIKVTGSHKAGRIHSVQIDNSSFEKMEEFKYLGTNVSNENSIEDEIRGTLKSENACCHSVQILLPSSLLSKT
jgi:hypothetical protein